MKALHHLLISFKSLLLCSLIFRINFSSNSLLLGSLFSPSLMLLSHICFVSFTTRFTCSCSSVHSFFFTKNMIVSSCSLVPDSWLTPIIWCAPLIRINIITIIVIPTGNTDFLANLPLLVCATVWSCHHQHRPTEDEEEDFSPTEYIVL